MSSPSKPPHPKPERLHARQSTLGREAADRRLAQAEDGSGFAGRDEAIAEYAWRSLTRTSGIARFAR
jgi:hypothetical protein